MELAIDQRLETLKSSIASLNYMQLLNELEEAAVEAENDPHGAAAKRQRALMADPKFELRLAPPRKQAEARTRRRTAAATAAEAAAAANGAPPRMRERIGSQGI